MFFVSVLSGDGIWKAASLFIVFTFVFTSVFGVYNPPKENVSVEEDLKNLDEEGYPKEFI